MSDIGEAILQAVRELGTRMTVMEGQLAAVIGEQAAMRAELTDMRGEMSIMRGDQRRMESRLTTVEARLANIEQAAAGLDVEIRSWPDMHFLAAAVHRQIEHNHEFRVDMREVKVRLKEIYQSMATDPEITSLREEVGHFRERSLEVDIRLGALESRLGVGREPTT